jgi:hypothetical protein
MATVAMLQGLDGRPIIDVIGVGAGVYDRGREVGLKAVAYVGSGKTTVRDRSQKYGFTNTRSAAYYHLRELLDPAYDPKLMLPPDDLMISDLTTPKWVITTGVPPRIQVEPKDKVMERLGRSPDRGDAIAMVMWADRLRGTGSFAPPVGVLPATGLSPLAGR